MAKNITAKNAPSTDVTVTLSKPVEDKNVSALMSRAVDAAGSFDAAAAEFLYTVARHENVGRGKCGVTVTHPVTGKAFPIGTVTDAFGLIGLDKTTGPRHLRRAALLRDVKGFDGPVGLAVMSSAAVGALFSDRGNATVVTGTTAANVRGALKRAAKPAAPKAPAAPESDPSDDENKGGGSTPSEGGGTTATTAHALPNGITARMVLIDQILANITPADLTSEDLTSRLGDIADKIDALLGTSSTVARAS